jgi:hypothetical protein
VDVEEFFIKKLLYDICKYLFEGVDADSFEEVGVTSDVRRLLEV